MMFTNPTMLPFRGDFAQVFSRDENNDYRSVIDDLTIRNKQLRKKLQCLEQEQQQAESEKLFEVRVHGLSSSKKFELEGLLKGFVRNLDQPVTGVACSPVAEPSHLQGPSIIAEPSSSHTSTKFADSGYGSLATSNHGFSQQASKKNFGRNRTHSGIEASTARNRSIQSYLHDIPEGLLPRQSPAIMTEEARKRMTVARLEQLFQGSGASAEGHQQPIQQQEVSQTAARDDRSAIEARGQRAMQEGKREACIMSADDEEAIETLAAKVQNDKSTSRDAQSVQPNSEKLSEYQQTEQRPTRPLDLDPHRAQDPRENVEYLRHLGFQLGESNAKKASEKDQGWLYLNLVFNMAQLHTLNVTMSLVKDAITDYSSRFELSPDGRKIRWRSEPVPKLLKSSSASDSPNISQRSSSGHGRKRARPTGLDASSSLESSGPSTSKKRVLGGSGKLSMLQPYTSQPETSELIDSEMYDDQSVPPINGADDPLSHQSLAWTNSGSLVSQSGSSQRPDYGTLVFYKSRKFFTDISSDHPSAIQEPRRDYLVRPMRPLGLQSNSHSHTGTSSLENNSAASVQAAVSNASLDVNADANSTPDQLSIHRASDSRRVSFLSPAKTVHFEASGLGYIYPADNFAVFTTRQFRRSSESPLAKRRKMSYLQDFVPMSGSDHHISNHITATKIQFLTPSSLPPPLYAVSQDGTDCGSDEEEQAASTYEYADTTTFSAGEGASEAMDAHSIDADSDAKVASNDVASDVSENESEDADEECEKRGGGSGSASAPSNTDRTPGRERSPSIDLLAAARCADPQAIQMREREYDAEIAERLAEDMPAGSSAATCGGRGASGFTSPVRDEKTAMDVYDMDEVCEDGEASVSS